MPDQPRDPQPAACRIGCDIEGQCGYGRETIESIQIKTILKRGFEIVLNRHSVCSPSPQGVVTDSRRAMKEIGAEHAFRMFRIIKGSYLPEWHTRA
jgi:hypothetical protein